MIKPVLKAMVLTLLLLQCLACDDENPFFELQQKQCYELIESGAYQEAYQLATDMTNTDQISDAQLSEGFYISGYALRKLNLFSESIVMFEKSIHYAENNDKKARVMANLGAVFNYVNEFQGATDLYLEAAAISDVWAPINYYNASLSQVDAGDYAGAAESIERGMKICDQDEFYMPLFYNQYGIIERDMFEISGNPARAKLADQYFRYAMTESNPVEMYKAKHYLATLKLMQQDTAAALALLQEAVTHQQDKQQRFHAVMDYATLLMEQGNTQSAMTQVDTALALYPQITRAREELKVFFLADRLGREVLNYHETEFDAYATELERAQQQYRAYIGRQIMKERESQAVRVYLWWGVGVMAFITCLVFAYFRQQRYAVSKHLKKIIHNSEV